MSRQVLRTSHHGCHPHEILDNNFIALYGLRFIGGAIGYISYDAIRYWEKIPEKAKDDLDFPDIELAIYDDGIMFDHIKEATYYYHSTKDRRADIESLIESPTEIQPLTHTEPKTNLSQKRFEEEVKKAEEMRKDFQ